MDGQNFFNMLSKYEPYIEEFFFSLTHSLLSEPLDGDEVCRQLSRCNTYGIPGNLLLNKIWMDGDWESLIRKASEVVDLQSATVLTYEIAKAVKEKFPHLKLHISTEGVEDLKSEEVDPEVIYCVNLYEPGIHGEEMQQILKACIERGVKTKFIANQPCFVNRHHMIRKLLNDKKIHCCNSMCQAYVKIPGYEWLDLCRVNYYKEMMDYWKPDYLKISSRAISTKEAEELINYWITPSRTERVHNLDMSKSYDLVLKWIKTRMTECTGWCDTCRKCEGIYKQLMERKR